MDKESKISHWSSEYSFKIFEDLVENRLFSRALFFASIAGLVISLMFDWGRLAPVLDDFKVADLYKISLLANGISPYSTPEPWLAPYPPFYFIIWVVPYLVSSNLAHLSFDQIFFAFRVLSTIIAGLCGLLIHRQLVAQGFSKAKSLSLSSIFVLSSLAGLIGLVGDFIGLLLLAAGCLFFLQKRNELGLLFISLAVAFKIQPVIGLAFLLISFVVVGFRRRSKRMEILRYFSVVAGLGVFFGAVPILVIPQAFSSFILYDTSHIQYYFFSVFTGLVDVFLNLFPAQTSSILSLADIAWWLVSISFVLLLLRYLLKEKFLRYANPIDLVSLGIIVWLIILKQTQPHYFLWVMIPLLVKGRTRSVLYVLAGEFFGCLFFGLAYVFGIPANYIGVPSIDSSLAFLVGGVFFTLFFVLAMLELLRQVNKERQLEPYTKASVSASARLT